jgi:hypothetical protein
MRPSHFVALISAAITLSACGGGNLKTAADYSTPAAPPVRNPIYNPYATYGTASASWMPPVINRHGTVVRPTDPAVLVGRPDYEHAEWATGAAGGDRLAPPGTF